MESINDPGEQLILQLFGSIVNLFAQTQYYDKREAVSPFSSLQAARSVVVMSCQR